MTTKPNSWMPQALRKLAGRTLQGALNHALALDPDARHQLAALQGESVQLYLRGPEMKFAVTVVDGQLHVGRAHSDESLRVTTTPGALLGMALTRHGDDMPPGKVEIAGDAGLARRVEKLVSTFAPDFEEGFTRLFGDVLGVPMSRTAQHALRHARDTAAHLREDAADWLRDEARLALGPAEVDDFLDGVDALRERSERLTARVTRLAARARGDFA